MSNNEGDSDLFVGIKMEPKKTPSTAVEIQLLPDFNKQTGNFTFNMTVRMNAMVLRLTISLSDCIDVGYIQNQTLTPFSGKIISNLLNSNKYTFNVSAQDVIVEVGDESLIKVVIKIPRSRFTTEFVPCKDIISAEYVCELLNQMQLWKQKATQIHSVVFSAYDFLMKRKNKSINFVHQWSTAGDITKIRKIIEFTEQKDCPTLPLDKWAFCYDSWDKKSKDTLDMFWDSDRVYVYHNKTKYSMGSRRIWLQAQKYPNFFLSGEFWYRKNKISFETFNQTRLIPFAYSGELETIQMESYPFYIELNFHSVQGQKQLYGCYKLVIENGFVAFKLINYYVGDNIVFEPVPSAEFATIEKTTKQWQWDFYDESTMDTVSNPNAWVSQDIKMLLQIK